MRKWLIPGLYEEMHKITLEHLVIPDNKATINSMSKGLRSQLE